MYHFDVKHMFRIAIYFLVFKKYSPPGKGELRAENDIAFEGLCQSGCGLDCVPCYCGIIILHMQKFFHNIKVAFKDLDAFIVSDRYISKKAKISLLVVATILSILYVASYVYLRLNEDNYSNITELVNNKEYIVAHQKLESILKKNPNDPYYLILAARADIGLSEKTSDTKAKKDYLNEALGFLNRVKATNPNLLETYKTMALTYIHLGDLSSAELVYKKVITLDHQSSVAWSDLGNVYVMRFITPEALESFDRALKIDPENEQALIGKIKILVLQNNFDRVLNLALHLYNKTADRDIKLELAQIIGNAYFKLTKYEEAKYYYNEGLKLDPLSVSINYGLAEVAFYSEFDFRKPTNGVANAIRLVENVIQIDSSYPYSYALLTRIAEATDNKSDYDKYLQITKEKMAAYPFISQKQKDVFLDTLPLYNKSSGKVT